MMDIALAIGEATVRRLSSHLDAQDVLELWISGLESHYEE